ncbi:MAG: YbaN family protein [Dehalococcoidia bacterium]
MDDTTIAHQSLAIRVLWVVAGSCAFAVGTAGIFLPLLPTTIFWIIAVACFSRGNPVWAAYILDHPRYGSHIRAYRAHGIICRRGKIAACGTITVSAFITLVAIPSLPIKVGVAVLLLTIGLWIASRPEEPGADAEPFCARDNPAVHRAVSPAA